MGWCIAGALVGVAIVLFSLLGKKSTDNQRAGACMVFVFVAVLAISLLIYGLWWHISYDNTMLKKKEQEQQEIERRMREQDQLIKQ